MQKKGDIVTGRRARDIRDIGWPIHAQIGNKIRNEDMVMTLKSFKSSTYKDLTKEIRADRLQRKQIASIGSG